MGRPPLTHPVSSGTLPLMQALPQSCPPLPELPPLFWNEVAKQTAYWQEFFAKAAPGETSPAKMRETCIARINTRLKRIRAGKKNAGRSLFEMAHFVACLTVIDSRN